MVWGLVSGFSALKNRSHGIILFLIKFILEAKHVGIILLFCYFSPFSLCCSLLAKLRQEDCSPIFQFPVLQFTVDLNCLQFSIFVCFKTSPVGVRLHVYFTCCM